MRNLILMSAMLLVPLLPVWGDPEQEQTLDPMFADGRFYYGSEPNFPDLVPDADPETSFDIGHLIFAYPLPYLVGVPKVASCGILRVKASVVDRGDC